MARRSWLTFYFKLYFWEYRKPPLAQKIKNKAFNPFLQKNREKNREREREREREIEKEREKGNLTIG